MGILYTHRVSTRARTMRLAVHPDGSVIVTAPKFFGLGVIERFVETQEKWITRHVNETKGRTVIRVERRDIPAIKRRAHELAHKRCEHFAKAYGVQFKKISIRAQKSRWGSCSRMGNLSFNYKIAVLPARLADYVIVHELCHLLEMNHSRRFWGLVAGVFPDHKVLRKELRAVAILYT